VRIFCFKTFKTILQIYSETDEQNIVVGIIKTHGTDTWPDIHINHDFYKSLIKGSGMLFFQKCNAHLPKDGKCQYSYT